MNQQLKNIQKSTGIKQGQFDNEHNRIYHACKTMLMALNTLVKQAEEAGLTDKDFWIDFEDELNTISIKDHSQLQ